MHRSRLAIAAALLMIGACSIGPAAKDPPVTYDLGPPPSNVSSRPAIQVTLLVPGVTAPAWLNHSGIAYRLGYHDPGRHQIYASSRWMAAPPVLLTTRLRSRFSSVTTAVVSGAEGVRADYALHVELEDFSQFFAAPESSRVAVMVRASLVRLADRTLHAQRSFSVQRPAGADAAGAVAALAEASDTLIAELAAWTAASLGAGRRAEERRSQ